jgi:membrane protein
MDWEKLIERVPDRLHGALLWLADLPPVTWLSSFSPVSFIIDVLKVALRASVGAYAAQIAFYLLMSLFPLAILMLQMLRAAPISQESLLFLIDSIVPAYLVTALHSLLQEVFATSFGLVPLTIVTMLWTTSKVVHSMVVGLDLIHTNGGGRNWVVVRVWSLLYTLLFVLVMLAIAGSTAAWQPIRAVLLRNRPHGISLSIFASFVRTIYTFLVGTFALAVLYKILPRRNLRFVRQLPGALVATLAVYVFTTGIAIYVSRFNGFSAYGSLTTLTLIMFWLYFCSYFIMLGAAINEVMRTRLLQREEAALLSKPDDTSEDAAAEPAAVDTSAT